MERLLGPFLWVGKWREVESIEVGRGGVERGRRLSPLWWVEEGRREERS